MDLSTIILFIVQVLAGAGVFLVGVRLLSSNIEQLATNSIKTLFNKTAKNKVVNIGIGALTTALVQSSGVTTVLIVGFVNVGLMSLSQATAMIMGANIGTTLTAQIAALSAFPFTKYIQFIAFLGIMISMITKKDKLKKIGLIVAGFGLIFIGLSLMSGSFEPVKVWVAEIFTNPLFSNPFLLLLIGIVLTALVQSSAAVTSIIISITIADLTIGNGGNSVLYIILGTNIGSTVTAIISSFGAKPNAKRASLIHLMFNTFGSVIFFIFLMIWPSFMDDTLAKWFSTPATQIAMFHTAFNVICTLLFYPAIPLFVKIATFIVKDEKEENEITYLDERMISTPALAIELIEKESMHLSDIAMASLNKGFDCFAKKTKEGLEESQELIEKANKLSKLIIDYIVKVSAQSNISQEKIISDLYNNIGDIMRIAEIADNFIKYTNKEIDHELIFSDEVLNQTSEMVGKLVILHNYTKEIILTKNLSILPSIDKVEDEVDEMRKKLVDGHIERLNKGECRPENSSIFINLVSNLERLGDHLTYIAYTVKN